MVKYVLLFIGVCCILSCKTSHRMDSTMVLVYQSQNVGQQGYHSYLILKSQPKTFELNYPILYSSILGVWSYSNDTLYLVSQYTNSLRNGENLISEISDVDISPQKFILKGSKLIDVSNYLSSLGLGTELDSIFGKVSFRENYIKTK